MPNFIVSSDWKWQTSTLPIRRIMSKNKNSSEQIFYQMVSSDVEMDPFSGKLKIWMDKQFPYEKGVGFVWHKSWNLPQIRLTINESENQELRSQFQQIKCEAMAVYPVNSGKFYYLQEVGLTGICQKPFEDNIFSMKYIKFAATSFNHQRNNFCLLLLVYGVTKAGDENDLFSIISSPIYVDSRKEARKVNKGANNLLFYSPKRFFTQICNKKNSQFNTPQGFLSYYGAQNIRNKIKHFFYLAYHFDKVFTIYKNKESHLSVEQILKLISVANKNDNASLLVVITAENDLQKKKILFMVEKWKFWNVEFGESGNPISNKWNLISKEQMKVAYKAYYEHQVLKQEDEQSPNDYEFQQEEDQDAQKFEDKRAYQLRTVIELSKGRKRVKTQEQY